MDVLISSQYGPEHKAFGIENGTFEEFLEWIEPLDTVEFDIETNVVQGWCEKELITMQFGWREHRVCIAWREINDLQRDKLKEVLQDKKHTFLIHNSAFEYIICRFHGIVIGNMACTMLAEKIIQGGIDNADYKLSQLTLKYCGVELDKTYQTAFGDGILTPHKVKYALDDVRYLEKIYNIQSIEIARWDMQNVLKLENMACKAYSDQTFYGMGIDVAKWRENIDLATPIIDASLLALVKAVEEDPILLQRAKNIGYYKEVDSINFNLNSPKQKLTLLQLLFPDINGTTKLILNKYMRDNKQVLKPEYLMSLLEASQGSYESLETLLVQEKREYLTTTTYEPKKGVEELYVFPANSMVINWNSQDQVLPLVRAVEPKLSSLSKDAVANTVHPIFDTLKEYTDAKKLVSSFGEKFLEHIEADGKVRTHYNQIVSTGRCSSSKPNLQQIPAKESVGNRYRNCFVYDKGWVFVDSDFVG